MKQLVLIEQEEDLQGARKFMSAAPEARSARTVINLNSGLHFDLSDLSGATYRTEEDYLKPKDLEPLNHRALEDTWAWLAHPEIAGFLTHQGIDLGLVFEHSLVRAVTTIYKFVDLFQAILKAEKPDEIIFFKSPGPVRHKDIRFTERDRLAGRLVQAVKLEVFAGKPVRTREILLENTGISPSAKDGHKKAYPFLRRTVSGMRRIVNVPIAWMNSGKKTLLVVGNPAKTFPIIETITGCAGHRIVYFQPHTAPRLIPWLLGRGIRYETLEDSPVKEEGPDAGSEKFTELLRRNGLFSYQGTDLTVIFEEKFDLLFGKLIPSFKANVTRFQQLFRKLGTRLVVIDEDIHYLSRTLILTARSLGIKCLEFQHGAVTKYFLQIEMADKKLVWGDYFKGRILEETRIPETSIAVVGPLHLERWADQHQKSGREKDLQEVQKLYQVPEGAKIVLFTPHGIHKSSRGGALNRHNTRQEAEKTLQEVVRVAQARPDLHLIIKLHHADLKPHFYEEFIARTAPGLRYSLVQFHSFYKLLNASDLLVTPVSTTILDGMMVERPIILLNMEKKRIPFPYREWGALEYVEEEGKLDDILRKLLDRPEEALAEVRAGRERIKRELLSGGDGRAASRIRAEVEKLLV